MQEIAAASQEQSQSVTQIGGAMGQLSKATQQNASASEELAATSEELSGQAEQLQQSVAFFSAGRARGAPRPRRPSAAVRAPRAELADARRRTAARRRRPRRAAAGHRHARQLPPLLTEPAMSTTDRHRHAADGGAAGAST